MQRIGAASVAGLPSGVNHESNEWELAMNESNALMDTRSACKVLGICERTLRSFPEDRLPRVRFGRRTLFDPVDLRRLVEASKSPASRSAEPVAA